MINHSKEILWPCLATDALGNVMGADAIGPSGTYGLRSYVDVSVGPAIDISMVDRIGLQVSWNGREASGTMTVLSLPPTGVILTIGTASFTSTSGTTSGNLWNTGTSTTLAAGWIRNSINAAAPGYLTASSVNNIVTITTIAVGTGSNYAISSSNAAVSCSASNLSGGAWVTGSIYIQTSHNYIPSGSFNREFTPFAGDWVYANSANPYITMSNQNIGTSATVITGLTAPWMRIRYARAATPFSGSYGDGRVQCALTLRG